MRVSSVYCTHSLFMEGVSGAAGAAGYMCAQCGRVHMLTSRDPVRCTKCGYRIMYKLRGPGAIACSAR